MTGGLPRVVVTGSESTGKTRLAADLATHYGTAWAGEFARAYVERKQAPLVSADVDLIALGQVEGEDEAARHAVRLIILDTDLLSTVVYSRFYYGACPEWVERAARDRRADLYLLLHPDVPWVADGPFRDQPEARLRLHELFREALCVAGARFEEVRGAWPDRRSTAIAAVDRLLAEGARPRPGSRSPSGTPA